MADNDASVNTTSSSPLTKTIDQIKFAAAKLIQSPLSVAVILLLWLALLAGPALHLIPVEDRDESRFGRAAIEMAERNEWFVPTFNNDFVANPDKELRYEFNKDGELRHSDYRFDKPIGVYWMMRASLYFFGETHPQLAQEDITKYLPTNQTTLALRLPAILSAYISAMILYGFSRRLYGKKAGFLAAFSWLSCLQVMIYARLIVADMPMIAAVCATMWSAYELLYPKNSGKPAPHYRNPWWVMFVLSLAWGFLVKGPIAWLVPLLGLTLARWIFTRQSMAWKSLAPISSTLVVIALISIWAIPANLATDWNYAKEGLGLHVVERGLSSFNGRISVPVLPYLIFAPISLLPWGALIPVALSRTTGNEEKRDPKRGFLLAWLLAPYLIFSFYATQLPHYVLPGLPAFFILLTRAGWPRVRTTFQRWFLIISTIIFLLVGAAILWIVFKIDWHVNHLAEQNVREVVSSMRYFVLSLATLIIVLASISLLTQMRRGAVIMTVFGFCAVSYISVFLIISLRETNPTLQLQKYWGEKVHHQKYHRAWHYNEPSLSYYATHEWVNASSPETIARWLKEVDNELLIIQSRSWRLDWPTFKSLLKPPENGSDSDPYKTHNFNADPHMNQDDLLAQHAPESYEFVAKSILGYNVAETAWVEVYVMTPRELTPAQQHQLEQYLQRQP